MRPETFRLNSRGWVPNHPLLPVLLYRAAASCVAVDDAMARALEERFLGHGWPPQWRADIYGYHHYHSTAHEVLGVAAGDARVMLGGPGGIEVTLHCGDIALLPAGTGHRQIQASKDFLVVGAYPPGQQFDICRSAPTDAMLERIKDLPFPSTDPVHGHAMSDLWTIPGDS